MTPTTFRHLRQYLGLSVAYAAESLGVSTRSISRWESGDTFLPGYAVAWLNDWVDRTEALVATGTLTAQMGGRLCLHSSEPAYRTAHRAESLDHLWWNRSAARVAAATGAELAYEACRPDSQARVLAPACDAEAE